jgi:polyhydroxyalkanoate synthesis regulator phasin
MEDLFKKFIYTGIGWISVTTEKFKDAIDGFISDGKISESEGKKIVDDFLKNTETKKDEIETQFGSVVDKIIKSFSFATTTEVDALEKKVAELEALIAKKSSAEKTKTKTVKKTATTKSRTTAKPKTTKKTTKK